MFRKLFERNNVEEANTKFNKGNTWDKIATRVQRRKATRRGQMKR